MNDNIMDNRIELYPPEVIAPRHVCDWCGEPIAFRLFGQLVAGSYSQIGDAKVCPACVKRAMRAMPKVRRVGRRPVARRAGAR